MPDCRRDAATASCPTAIPALLGASGVAVSPDGASVYVAAQGDGTAAHPGALLAFTRAGDGSLSPAGCLGSGSADGCTSGSAANGLGRAATVALAPDGSRVFVGGQPTPALVNLSRAPDGSLTNVQCFAAAAPCTAPTMPLPRVAQIAPSPDGSDVYLTGPFGSSGVVSRFAVGAGGILTESACYRSSATPAPCATGTKLSSPGGIAAATDAVYVAAVNSRAIDTFTRPLTQAGCVNTAGSGGCAAAGGSLFGVKGIIVSPDAANVYAGVDTGKLFTLSRGPLGALTPLRCQPLYGASVDCNDGATNGSVRFASAPDGSNLYAVVVTSGSSAERGILSTFFRAARPVVTTGAATDVTPTSARIGGTVSPVGLPTTARIKWGPTLAYESATDTVDVGSGRTPADIGVTLTGLEPGTTYHYRLAAESSSGPSVGEDRAFTTPTPAPPEGPPPSGPPPSDTPPGGFVPREFPSPVRVTGFTATPATFALGSRLASNAAKRPKTGTVLRFTLNRDAAVRIVFTRYEKGRRKGARCKPASVKLRKAPKCKRVVTVAPALALAGRGGANAVRFEGRIDRRTTLKPGRYTLTLTATADRLTSRPATTKVTVMPARAPESSG